MRITRVIAGTAGVVAAAALLSATASASGAAVNARHDQAPKHGFGRGTSTNWSGYVVPGKAATRAIGSWVVPAVTCAPGENSWSSPWVGIDGDTSNTVEQTGTDSDCANGVPTYYAWYEMYPKSLVVIAMAITPGDSVTAEVSYTSTGGFKLALTDNSSNTSFVTSQASRKALRTSVEWIVEGPSGGLLSNFGSTPFSAAPATINGQSGNLGSFAGADPLTMVNRRGVVRAVPSAVTGGTSFTVTWRHG